MNSVRVVVLRLKSLMDSRPMLSNACIYGGLYTLAEVSQQTMRSSLHSSKTSSSSNSFSTDLTRRPAQNHPPGIDLSSVKRYAIMGTLVFPPILTHWYRWLEARFPCTSPRVVARKLLLDQFLLTPWVVVLFFIGMAALEGKQGWELTEELKEKGFTTFFLDCCYWLPVQYLNFKFVPAWLRVSYIGVTTFLWLNILCFIKSQPSGLAFRAT